MNKDTKKLFIIMAFAVVFVLGLFAGHYDVIHHSKVYEEDNSYIVEFDGNLYKYDKG